MKPVAALIVGLALIPTASLAQSAAQDVASLCLSPDGALAKGGARYNDCMVSAAAALEPSKEGAEAIAEAAAVRCGSLGAPIQTAINYCAVVLQGTGFQSVQWGAVEKAGRQSAVNAVVSRRVPGAPSK
jgi:predicted nucleic acid-binding Zn ribbon protein